MIVHRRKYVILLAEIERFSMIGIHTGLKIIMLYISRILDNLQNASTSVIMVDPHNKIEEHS